MNAMIGAGYALISSKLFKIFSRLDEVGTPQAMNLPGHRLHQLKGDLKGFGQSQSGPIGVSFFAFKAWMHLM